MTGRDLIIYILTNHLEDEKLFKDGKFIGFKTDWEVAADMHVGVATVDAWFVQGLVYGAIVEGKCYIFGNYREMLELGGIYEKAN